MPQICADLKFAAKSMPKYAAERNFAADLPHTMTQEQSVADLPQKSGKLYSLPQAQDEIPIETN